MKLFKSVLTHLMGINEGIMIRLESWLDDSDFSDWDLDSVEQAALNNPEVMKAVREARDE